MKNKPPSRLLTEGIRELGNALFSNSSRSLIKLPTDVVHDVVTDPSGYVWFQVSTRLLDLDGLDKTFPAQLRFYNKHCPYSITLDGNATLLSDTTTIPPILPRVHPGRLQIRFYILYAERHQRAMQPHPVRKSFRRVLTTIFPVAPERTYAPDFLSGAVLPA